jgi:DNA mismatch repair protein MutS
LEDGPAGRSFGVAVARLAGLPDPVIARARAVLAHLEGDDATTQETTRTTTTVPSTTNGHGLPRAQRRLQRGTPTPQLALFQPPVTAETPVGDERAARVLEKLRATDVMRLTPLQAMNALAALVDDARRS